MGLLYHSFQLPVHFAESRLRHQSHHGQRKCLVYISVTYEAVAALMFNDLIDSGCHILVIVPHNKDIVGIVGDGGRESYAADAVPLTDSPTDKSASLIQLQSADLAVSPAGDIVFCLFKMPKCIGCCDLSRIQPDHMHRVLCDRQPENTGSYGIQMNGSP